MVSEGMNPIPKLIVVQIAIDVCVVSIVFRVLFRIVYLGLVAKGRADVIFVKIFTSVCV